VPPAAVPINGHDTDDVSVTVLKNVVHVKDDTQGDSKQFVRQVALSDIADVIDQPIGEFNIVKILY